jgi:hypothetical protein
MRLIALLGLVLLLAGCEGDRTRQGLNERHAQPQATVLA